MASGSASPGRVAARGGLVAAFLFYCALAVASGLDRASAAHPELAQRVPAPFASQALRSEAVTALTVGEAHRALALGERAVDAAPLDPASTAILGAARYAAGNRGGADRAFRIAARLGWRIPFTQLYMMGRALELGDYRLAALRLDALARQNPAVLGDRRLLDPFERTATGRTALAQRLLAAPPWLRPYATTLQSLPADRLAQRVAVLSELDRQGGKLGCRMIGPAVSRLIAGGAVVDAAALWRAHCPAAARALIYDGSFAAASLDQNESEFAWVFIGQSEVSTLIEPGDAPSARIVAIDSSADRAEQVMRQLVLLKPGTYRLSWRAQTGEGAPSDRIVPQFACVPTAADWLEPRLDTESHRWFATLAMDGACPARWLGFAIKPGSGAVRLGDVQLEPIG